MGERPEFGYHSQISAVQDVVKWVQVDLGKPTAIEHILYVSCHDTFNGIGAGFGFPVRYKIEVSDDKGNLITTLSAGKRRGINRVEWPMRMRFVLSATAASQRSGAEL